MIRFYLGYSDNLAEPLLSPERMLRANSLMSQLDAIDSALTDARLMSDTVEVDKVKMNYVNHLAILKSEGSRLLQELSRLVGLPITYDKYLQLSYDVGVVGSVAQPNFSRNYFVSYW